MLLKDRERTPFGGETLQKAARGVAIQHVLRQGLLFALLSLRSVNTRK